MTIDLSQLKALEWRNIGPHRGGRVVAVAGDPRAKQTFYFGACAGGVWKTNDGGTYWRNVSDASFGTAAVGALAVAPSDPNVIYAGTGEACIRLDVSHGDGVYRSTDAGRTWRNVGLADSRHISRVRVHPTNPDLVYVAALGHAFGPNPERGIYRSKNGGAHWERVLFVSAETGAADLAMDPTNPRILFACMWQARREPWNMTSGGPESAIYRSADGGDSWEVISGRPGMPKAVKGRMGVAISPARPDRAWAIIEAGDDQGGLYRTDDAGATWQRVSDNGELIGRPWYYSHVFADPRDAETVWVLNIGCWRSTDGGRTFDRVATPHGDNHDLWIDPEDPARMIEGNDGGACVSFNGGETWSTIYNQPTAQFYHLAIDSRWPYRVYGTQQDNTAIAVPSRSRTPGIPYSECYQVGSSESGYIAVHPDDPDIVVSGATGSAPGGGGPMWHYNHRTRQTRLITVLPEWNFGEAPADLKHRFPWTYPISFSPHDPSVLYSTGECVFRSRDEGTSWVQISPDLTRNDPWKLRAPGGPISLDTSGAETYCTLSVLTESRHEKGVLWAGSDDGIVHISRDGGDTWRNVTPDGVPAWSYISSIDVSPHDPATAWLAATRYKLDGLEPLVFVTRDYGETWRSATGDLPANAPTRVVREDPARAGLLYTGSETAVYASLDGGERWQSLRLNLPAVPVYDLLVHGDDLVIATHGRGFWVLDDLEPLRKAVAIPPAAPELFTPEATYRYGTDPRMTQPGTNYAGGGVANSAFVEEKGPDGKTRRVFLDAGTNPPNGVRVYYALPTDVQGAVTLRFRDDRGNEIRSFTSSSPAEPAPAQAKPAIPPPPAVPAEPGFNRFVWDMRYADAAAVPGDESTKDSLRGPLAAPGRYTVELEAGGAVRSARFEIRKDPGVASTQEDLDAQFELLIGIRDRLTEANSAVNRIRNIRRQVAEWVRRSAGQAPTATPELGEAARRVDAALEPIEDALIDRKFKYSTDRLKRRPGINGKIAGLTPVVASADAVPTQGAYEMFRVLSDQLAAQQRDLEGVVANELAELNRLARASGAEPVDGITATPPVNVTG